MFTMAEIIFDIIAQQADTLGYQADTIAQQTDAIGRLIGTVDTLIKKLGQKDKRPNEPKIPDDVPITRYSEYWYIYELACESKFTQLAEELMELENSMEERVARLIEREAKCGGRESEHARRFAAREAERDAEVLKYQAKIAELNTSLAQRDVLISGYRSKSTEVCGANEILQKRINELELLHAAFKQQHEHPARDSIVLALEASAKMREAEYNAELLEHKTRIDALISANVMLREQTGAFVQSYKYGDVHARENSHEIARENSHEIARESGARKDYAHVVVSEPVYAKKDDVEREFAELRKQFALAHDATARVVAKVPEIGKPGEIIICENKTFIYFDKWRSVVFANDDNMQIDVRKIKEHELTWAMYKVYYDSVAQKFVYVC